MPLVSLLFHDLYVVDPRESGFVSPAADRYKLQVDEFDAQLLSLSQRSLRRERDHTERWSNGDARRSAMPVPPAFVSSTHSLITVDDGGVSFYTLLADRLEAFGWRAHCFVSTNFIGQRGFLTARQIRELDARGHVIGSHSASHPSRFSACSTHQMRHEWASSRQVLEDMLGHAVGVASVPGGYYSRHVARAAAEAGIRALFTSEPVTTVRDVDGCTVAGRFTIRHGHAPGTAGRLTGRAPWARWAEWLRWNTKGIVKPVLGPSYGRVADWVLGEHHG